LVQKLGFAIAGNIVVCKKLTFDKLVHDTNAFVAIVVTELGIVMEVRPEQFRNAFDAILVTLYIIPFESLIVGGILIIPLALAAKTCELVWVVMVASVILVVYNRPLDASKNAVLSTNAVCVIKNPDNGVLLTPDL